MKSAMIENHFETVNGIKMHYLQAGEGPVLVLLHGMAGSSYTWRYVIPELSESYTVLVPDLRGFGDTEKPETGYDKKNMAEDIYHLLEKLGHYNILIAAHDFGGQIGYALASTHPGRVRALAVFECLIMTDADPAKIVPWFVSFFQTPDIPEILLKGHEKEFLRILMDQLTINKLAIQEEDLDEYARSLSMPGAVKAAAGMYRSIPKDLKDNESFFKKKLTIPILAFGADHVMKSETVNSFKMVGVDVQGGVVSECGHFVPEERPAFVISELIRFFNA